MTDRRGWPEAMRYRCFVLWSGPAWGSAGRTRRILRQDLPDEAPLPGASTIRRWAAQERWKDWRGDDVPPMPWRDPRQRHIWQLMWHRHAARQIEVALRVQNAVLTGAFDGDPAASMETFVSMDRLLAQPALRAIQRLVWQDLFSEQRTMPVVSLTPRERRAWLRLTRRTMP